MKKKKWYRGFGLADDKYVAEAHPDNVIKPKRNRVFTSVLAACACFALLFSCLWLFIPYDTTPPDVSRYADSEYYGIIEKLNVLTYERPRYKNNAARLWAKLISFGQGKADYDAAPPTSEAPVGGYQEITDNQVGGVIEADRIKRSDTHIYYLDGATLRIFSIEKENTEEVGSYAVLEGMKYYDLEQWELYLSQDCRTVTVVAQHHIRNESGIYVPYVKLISLDVTDPENIVRKNEFSITGDYSSSRMTDGNILLLTEFVINKQELDFGDESTFLPQIDEGDGFHSIPASGIISPESLNSARYTVVMKLDEDTLGLEGTAAYLSYSEDAYVSEDHVFLTRVFADKKDNGNGSFIRNSMTEISCLSYGGDSFEKKGSVTVRGYVKDQWSMDEYEGVLRVFTTTNATTISEKVSDSGNVSMNVLESATGQSNASLYCIDLSSFEVVASVIDFAPPREEIQSVRFDKEVAYVCTSIERSDPVFFFDLSDLSNVTYKDTGTIEGFSTSLINLGGGYLLGIGTGGVWNSFKVEVYEEAEETVRSVCSYELKKTEYSTEYKSYYVDRQNQLIGIGILDYSLHNSGSNEFERYILLHFDGYELVELVNVALNGNPANMRGVYIDGYMYMFGEDDFKVEKVFD